MKEDDIVLCPDGQGRYYVAVVRGPYQYVPGTSLPHRRPVEWLTDLVDRSEMSPELRNSTGTIGTLGDISKYAEEVESLIGQTPEPDLIASDKTVEDATVFALEKHLEDFLVSNWQYTDLGRGMIFTKKMVSQ